jgi:hypothetical protein
MFATAYTPPCSTHAITAGLKYGVMLAEKPP